MKRNAGGWRIGSSHPRATVSDEIVHELRELHEHKKIRVQQLIELFASRDPPVILKYRFVRKIVSYERRAHP